MTDQQTLHLSATVKEKRKSSSKSSVVKQTDFQDRLYTLQNVKYAAIFVKKGIKHIQVFAF